MPESISIRPFNSEYDYNQIAEILVASENADNRAISISAKEMKGRLSQSPHFDIRRDLVISEMNGQAVGYGRVSWVDDASSRIYWLTGFIRPEARRKGLGSAILKWLEERSHKLMGDHPSKGRSSLQINATQFQTGLHILAQKAGYRVKESWVLMVRPSLAEIPDIPLPPGLEVRPALPEHFSAIWQAMEEAYVPQGGPEPTGIIPEDFRTDPNFQPELWQVAWEVSTGKVVGSVMTYINHAENKQLEILRGYTEGISTVPVWQRRGVAKALIVRSLQVQRAAGMTQSALICSGEKPNEYHLYQSCGFQEVKRDTVYEKPLET